MEQVHLLNLDPGDRIRLGEEVLTVAEVEQLGAALVIVDFVDGTSTPPVPPGTWVWRLTD